MEGRAIVIGGSIGGLFAAALLLRKGWDVEVYERAEVELTGRGAGIVTHRPLIDALEAAGARTDDVGILVEKRVAYDRAGKVTHVLDLPQIVTSWDRLQTLIRATIPERRYRLGHWLDRFEVTADGVGAVFKNGHTIEADLIVGADGFRSSVRAQIFPEVQPDYAGYVVWRGVANEADLTPDLLESVFRHFGFCLPEGDGQMLGYPIAGADNDLRVGHRRYHWGWYRVVESEALSDLLTDARGVAHKISIPPPLVRRDIIARLRAAARRALAPQFATLLDRVKAPFFTPVYDLAAPSMVSDRVAMVGDAAFLARPHIGAGVTKAAEDAVSLAQCLSAASGLQEGLTAYNAERLKANRIAYDRARYLGEYLTPSYKNEAEKAAWARQHNIETILRDTAVLNFY
ncbi:MAG: FAD binding domain-containing protein [Rhodospirillales bacterium]